MYTNKQTIAKNKVRSLLFGGIVALLRLAIKAFDAVPKSSSTPYQSNSVAAALLATTPL
jgi:hypothetical protein